METLHCSNGQDETRVKRAFGWVVTFRDFPAGSWQSVDGTQMMTKALTLFTKGRAEFYLNGERRGDRVPGILSSEHEPVGIGGTFKLVYVEPTTRLCIPGNENINRNRLPTVKKFMLDEGETHVAQPGDKLLICLGSVQVNTRSFQEEQSFKVNDAPAEVRALSKVILLQFLD